MNISPNKYEVEYAAGGPGLVATVLSFGTIHILNEMLKSATGSTDGIYCKITDKETGENVEEWGKDIHEAEKKAFKGLMRKVNGDRFELSFSPEGVDVIETVATLGINILVHELLGWDSGWYCRVKDAKTGIEEVGYGDTKFDAMISAHQNIKQKVSEKEAEERNKIEEEKQAAIRQKLEEEAYKQQLIREQEELYRLQQIQRENNNYSSEGSAEGCAVQLGIYVALAVVAIIALVYIFMIAVALIAVIAPIAILIGHFVRSKKYIPFANNFTDSSTDENPMHQSPWSAGVSTFLSAVLVWGVWKSATIQGITRELGGDSLQNYIGYIYLFVGGIAFFFFLKSLLQNILPYRENGKFFWREDSRLLMVGASVLCLLCGIGYEFYTRNEIVPSNETVTNVSVNQNTIENNNEKQLNTNSDDEYISFIKKRYSEIKASKNLETKNYEFSEFDDNSCGFGATLTYFLENGNIVEIDFETRMGKNITTSEDYFENGKLFFSFSTYTTSSTASHLYEEQQRYYIKDENCILYKYKEKLVEEDKVRTDINEVRACSDSAKNEVIKGANNLYNGYGSNDMRKVVCE